jgi:hypothetical protein
MGCRVHVISKHEKFGDSEYFNWSGEDFNDLLEDLGCDMCSDEYGSMTWFECNVDEYKRALKLIKAFKKDKKKAEKLFDEADLDINDFQCHLEDLGGLDKVIEAMEAFYKERDKQSDWISFKMW